MTAERGQMRAGYPAASPGREERVAFLDDQSPSVWNWRWWWVVGGRAGQGFNRALAGE